MMIKLERNLFDLVKPLINENFLSNQLECVINGSNNGSIYVDKEDPSVAMIYHQGENGYYFIGDACQTDFLKDVLSHIKEINGSNDYFEFSGDSPDWHQSFKKVFGHLNLSHAIQEIYISTPDTPLRRLENNYSIEKISQPILDDHLKLKSIIESWWPSTQTYLKYNMGYVIKDDDKIIGHCVLDGASEPYMGIGIAVDEEYRKKGLATSLATYVITDILEGHCKVYWECTATNKASRKTAMRCGLVQHGQYNLYWFDQKNCS